MEGRKPRPLAGFITSVIAGLLIILASLVVALPAAFLSALTPEAPQRALEISGTRELVSASSTGFLYGFLVIAFALIGYLWNRKLGGWGVIALSILSLFAISLFASLGLLAGIVGGILLLAGK
jgi:hypothetical protein